MINPAHFKSIVLKTSLHVYFLYYTLYKYMHGYNNIKVEAYTDLLLQVHIYMIECSLITGANYCPDA